VSEQSNGHATPSPHEVTPTDRSSDWPASFARTWPLWIGAAAATAGAVIGLVGGFSRLHASWTDAYSYSHGYLVLLMSGWLFARNLRSAPIAELRPSLIGFGMLLIGVAGYVLAEIVDVTIGIQAMMPVLLLSLVAALAGLPLARRALVPVAFLYFAIPLWNLLTIPLQNLTTVMVTSALRISNISAYIEGYVVATPSGSFEIAQGCSGLHFLVVGLALAAFYGLAWYRRWSARALLFAVAGAASIVANWLRVYVLIDVGERTNMQHYLIAEDH
jgi:exosortase